MPIFAVCIKYASVSVYVLVLLRVYVSTESTRVRMLICVSVSACLYESCLGMHRTFQTITRGFCRTLIGFASLLLSLMRSASFYQIKIPWQ